MYKTARNLQKFQSELKLAEENHRFLTSKSSALSKRCNKNVCLICIFANYSQFHPETTVANISPIKVLVADDHTLFRQGMSALLNSFDGIEVVGQAANGKELVGLVETTRPQVVLTDIQMPEMDGIEATKIIRSNPDNKDIKIIAISMFDGNMFVLRMIELGANGYLLKNDEPNEVERAINTVVRNDFYMNRNTMTAMLSRITTETPKTNLAISQADLKDREIQILTMICEEYTSKQIAEMLNLTAGSIETYRTELLRKTGAKNTAGLVVFAFRTGIMK